MKPGFSFGFTTRLCGSAGTHQEKSSPPLTVTHQPATVSWWGRMNLSALLPTDPPPKHEQCCTSKIVNSLNPLWWQQTKGLNGQKFAVNCVWFLRWPPLWPPSWIFNWAALQNITSELQSVKMCYTHHTLALTLVAFNVKLNVMLEIICSHHYKTECFKIDYRCGRFYIYSNHNCLCVLNHKKVRWV